MKLVKRSSVTLIAGAALCFTSSACGQPEPLRTVSDFCAASKRISAEPAPAAGADDPGNRFDTDQTFGEIVAHNAVVDRLCPPAD